jgi:small GTP-binding protein
MPPLSTAPKVVLVGDSGAGKTSIANAYTKGPSATKPTITATALRGCRERLGNTEVCFDLWDTAGQESYKCLVPIYARGAVLALLVFDKASLLSFKNLSYWIDFLKLDVGIDSLIVVGNKTDLPAEVTKEEARILCREIGADYVETSAKFGTQIDALFQMVARKVLAASDESKPTHHKASESGALLLNTGPGAGGDCPCST